MRGIRATRLVKGVKASRRTRPAGMRREKVERRRRFGASAQSGSSLSSSVVYLPLLRISSLDFRPRKRSCTTGNI